jgi:hypothetical protein
MTKMMMIMVSVVQGYPVQQRPSAKKAMVSLLDIMNPNSAYNLGLPSKLASRTSSGRMHCGGPNCDGDHHHDDAPSPQRRDVLRAASAAAAAAAAVGMPFRAQADGARSKATRERARQIYGSRIYRLQGAGVPVILDEKGVFDIFIDGAYGGLADDKSKAAVKSLKELQKTVLASAIKGDGSGASAAVKEFVKVAKITEQDKLPGNVYAPTLRRNAGAPVTDQIEDQMGSMKKALYGTMKDF